MLKYLHANMLYSFDQLNPSAIGNKVRWVKENAGPDAQRGLYFEVASYEERSKKIVYADNIELVRTEIRIKAPNGQQFTVAPQDHFAVDEPTKAPHNGLFLPDMSPAEYTYDFVGGEIVGNVIMATTGPNSNHSWGDFITGVVTSYKRSSAVTYGYGSHNSIMYEVGFQGLDRPVVVDSQSSFWA